MRWRINPTIWFYKAEDVKVDCDKTPMQRTPTLSALRTGLSEFCPTSVVAGTTEGKLGVWQGGSLVSQGFPGSGKHDPATKRAPHGTCLLTRAASVVSPLSTRCVLELNPQIGRLRWG